jgi:hypothetical protein
MKKWFIAFIGAISIAVGANAFVQNPLPGYVWTYFGPTLGSDWAPTTLTPPITYTAVFSAPGPLPNNILSFDVGNFGLNSQIPAAVEQTFVSGLVVPSSYTQGPWPNTNFSAYCENQNNASGSSCVPYFSVGLASGGINSSAWNLNGILSNTDRALSTDPSQRHYLNGAGLGHDFSNLNGYECNPNIWKVGTATPAGIVNCLKFGGGGEVVPTQGAFAMHAWPFNIVTGLKWSSILYTEDGASTNSISLGANTTIAPNVPSQTITLRGFDGASAPVAGFALLDTSQYFHLIAPTGVSASNGIGTLLFASDSTFSRFGGKFSTGTTTIQPAANGNFLSHQAADQNFEINQKVNLADGVSLRSVTDDGVTDKGLEFMGSTIRLSSTNVNVNGTVAVSCAAGTVNLTTFVVTNGIVTHC